MAAAPTVEVTVAAATVPSGTTGLIRRPNSLNSATGLSSSASAGGGSPVASPTTASLRPVSAPFLPHQSAATEASGGVDRLPSNNNEENNNDDKGELELSGWKMGGVR